MKKHLFVIVALVTLYAPVSVEAAAANMRRFAGSTAGTIGLQTRNKSWDALRGQQVLEAGPRSNLIKTTTYRIPQEQFLNHFPSMNTTNPTRMTEQMNRNFIRPGIQASTILTPEQQRNLDEATQQFMKEMDASQELNDEQDFIENTQEIDKNYPQLQEVRDRASLLMEANKLYGDALTQSDLKFLRMIFKRRFESLDPLDIEQRIKTWQDYETELFKVAQDTTQRKKLSTQK